MAMTRAASPTPAGQRRPRDVERAEHERDGQGRVRVGAREQRVEQADPHRREPQRGDAGEQADPRDPAQAAAGEHDHDRDERRAAGGAS